MKKIILGITGILLVTCLTFTIIIINLNSNVDKEVYVLSFDKRSKFVLGEYGFTDRVTSKFEVSFKYETTEAEKIKSDMINSQYYVGNYYDSDYLLYDGYYYSFYVRNGDFIIVNQVNETGVYSYPKVSNKSSIDVFFNRDPEKNYNKDGFYYVINDWKSLSENEYVMPIDSKENFISFINTLNKNIAYYNEENSTVYMNIFVSKGACLGSRASSNYPIRFILFDDCIHAGYSSNHE